MTDDELIVAMREAFWASPGVGCNSAECFRDVLALVRAHDKDAPTALANSGPKELKEAFDALAEELTDAQAELAAERDRAETLKQQAEIWAQEARTQKATVQEIYQLCTGATGEPGDWNGAEPVRRALAAERAKVERLRGALIDANDICRSAFTIANRIATEFSTIEFNTMFGAFAAKAKESLCRQHTVIHETGGYPRAAIGVETGEV